MEIFIAAFDLGTRNFAFCIQKVFIDELDTLRKKVKPSFNEDGTCSSDYETFVQQVYKTGEVVYFEVIDLVGESNDEQNLLLTLTDKLNQYTSYWDRTNVFLVEQQMSYGQQKTNIQALKLAQHCISYFYTVYGNFKVIMDYPSQHKTRILGCDYVKRKKHKTRKLFSVELATKILSLKRNDPINLFMKWKKKDDISDCLLMIETFKIKYF